MSSEEKLYFGCNSSGNSAGISNNTQICTDYNKEVTLYICEKCGQSFQNKTSILSHNKWKHENPNSNHTCSVCQKTFTRRYHLDRHTKNCHNKPRQNNIKKNKICCSVCDFSAASRAEVLTHYEVGHNVNIVKETLKFNTFEEFNIWKQKFEKDTKSRFIKTTRTRHTKGRRHIGECNNTGGLDISNYICHRDGYFHSRSKGIRHIKMVGSNKINSYCPANIIVYATDQSVKVVYMGTHVGHELDLGHLNISESERANIAEKLAMKIPFEQILDSIRDSVVNSELDRIHLATRKDLWNIADSYNLNHEAILNKNDYLSVEAWVSHIQKSSNLVRFYKPQGVLLENFPQLKKEDFFLIIMNDAQNEILQKFGNDCVCIDGTHGLNAYDFHLYTIMVLDDMRQGFPCSFLFSNRGDTVAMEIFFRTIKDCLHNTLIKPKTFMSDMDDTFYNAWSAILGPVPNRLFCSWHVDRAWRKNLNKIKNREKQAVVYKKIKIIMYEIDLGTFSVMVNNLLDELRSDTECLEFFEYFETYVKKCQTWAYCYRKQCEINTNMNLENMHRILKHIYFGGKKVKRMDKAITILMKFIRDKLFDRLVILNKGKISKKLAAIRQIHKKSVELINTVVDVGDSWDVSATNCDDIYKVEATNITCSCSLRCQDCESCIHQYTCSCIDFYIKWNMCKHIHLVCMFLKSKTLIVQNISDSTPVEEICNNEMVHVINDDKVSDLASNKEEKAILSVVDKDKRYSFDKRKQDMMNKVWQVCNTIQNEEQLEAVLKQVAPLESIINALSKKDIIFPKTPREPPNKKIKTQMRFSSTKKKNKLKKKKYTNPSKAEKNILTLEMVGKWQENNL